MKASKEQIDAAQAIYETDEVNIDDNAIISSPEDGSGYWVSAWVWVSTGEPNESV